jgi:hypothetical protein
VKLLGRFMAILMALLFVVTLPCAIWTLATGQLLTNGETYKNALITNNAYVELIPSILPAMVEASDDPEIQAEIEADPDALTFLNIIGNMEKEDWEIIANELVPPDWLRQQIEGNLDAFFGWLNNERPVPDLHFDTGSLRDRLSGAEGQRAVNLILTSWPECSEEQIDTLLNFEEQSSETFPFCQPPGDMLAFTSQALSDTLRNEARSLPDAVPNPNWLQNDETRRQLNQIKHGVRIIQAILIEFLLIPLAFLSLVIFFTVRSLKAFGRWSGIMLLITGVFTALPIPFLVSPFLLPATAATLMGDPSINMEFGPGSQRAAEYSLLIVQDIIRSITGELTLPVLVMAAGLIVLGFIGLVISAIARDPEEVMNEHLMTTSGTPLPTGAFTPTGQVTSTQAYEFTPPQTPVSTTPPASPTFDSGQSGSDPFLPPEDPPPPGDTP